MGAGRARLDRRHGAPQVEVALAHDITLLANALGPPPKAASTRRTSTA